MSKRWASAASPAFFAAMPAREGGWLVPDALIVVEEAKGKFSPPAPFAELERRPYDDTELIFLRQGE